MILRHNIQQLSGEILTLEVDHNGNDWVFVSAYMTSIDGRTSIDLSDIFHEHFKGDKILEEIDWREYFHQEHIEEAA